MKSKKVLTKFPQVKKTLKDFMADEDGYVSKESVLKVGLSTLAGIGVLGSMSDVFAGHTSVPLHTNAVTFSTTINPAGCLAPDAATHNNAPGHHSHSSY